MGKRSKVTFMLVLSSLVLLPVFMGGCVIPNEIRALIEDMTTPVVQPSPEPLLPSNDVLVPTDGLQPLPDNPLFFLIF
jgi:hypothetical protein